ncbi:hypothetical protein ACFSS8_06025 [Paracoccus kondratievae]
MDRVEAGLVQRRSKRRVPRGGVDIAVTLRDLRSQRIGVSLRFRLDRLDGAGVLIAQRLDLLVRGRAGFQPLPFVGVEILGQRGQFRLVFLDFRQPLLRLALVLVVRGDNPRTFGCASISSISSTNRPSGASEYRSFSASGISSADA